MVQTPSPFVYWAQDADNIYLKVDLKDIKGQNVKLDKNSMTMSANGVGAHGPSNYTFTLQFFNELDSDVDFERWKSEDDDLSDDVENTPRDVMGDYPELFEKLKKDEFGYVKEDFRKVYLVFYNLTQFIFFTYIIVVMGIRYMKEGTESIPGTYEAVGAVLKFAQLIQYLEVMHPLFGYTKGSMLAPFIQVTGRNIVLFGMIEAEPRLQTKPLVCYLIFVWSLIEVVRYPYYITALYKKNIGLLTWLRYTLWIPLYPLGALCEGIIILRNIPYFEETQRFVISMPNSWNVTFHTPTLMRVYLLFFFIPGIYFMMSQMHHARIKKLGPRKWKRKFS